MQLFNSSKQSIWPILLSVTSLLPGVRMNAENVILAGIWQGPIKPPMRLTLPPVLDKIHCIKTHGIPVHTPGIVRACLLVQVFDLPAKAMAMNITYTMDTLQLHILLGQRSTCIRMSPVLPRGGA